MTETKLRISSFRETNDLRRVFILAGSEKLVLSIVT